MPSHKTKIIDINCDLGEGATIAQCETDAQLMPFISRCNIACGGHAGNIETMRQSILNATHHHLKCGAHPGYPDKSNFGRKSIEIPLAKLLESIQEQIDTLKNIATSINTDITHIKLHGALYNDAEKHPLLAEELCKFLSQTYPDQSIVGLANGLMQQTAQKYGITFLKEGFIDRAYLNNGQLTPRSIPNSVLTDVAQTVQQGIALASGLAISGFQGKPLVLEIDTLCLHGDNQSALLVAQKLFEELTKRNFQIK